MAIESHLEEISWRNKHVNDELLLAFRGSTIFVHGDVFPRWRAIVYSAVELARTRIEPLTSKMGCMCDFPVDFIPYNEHEEKKIRCWSEVAPLNFRRMRHVAHKKVCGNAKRCGNEKRCAVIDEYGKLTISKILSAIHMRLQRKKRAGDSIQWTEGSRKCTR